MTCKAKHDSDISPVTFKNRNSIIEIIEFGQGLLNKGAMIETKKDYSGNFTAVIDGNKITNEERDFCSANKVSLSVVTMF